MTFWVAGAVVVGGLASSAIGASAAGSAANQQAQAAQNAQNISQNQFNTINQQEQPFLQSGYGAQSQLNYLLGIGSPGQGVSGGQPVGSSGQGYNPSSGYNIGSGGSISQGIPGGLTGGGYVGSQLGGLYGGTGRATGTQGMGAGGGAVGTPQTASGSSAGGFGSLLTPFTTDTFHQMSPAYQFQLQQGQQGVLNADSSSQGALGGAALKDLTGYNQGLANTSFNNAFNQYQTQQGNIYSRLAGIANLGQSAASQTAQSGTALAGQAAQSATNIGTAQAAGTIGQGNAWSSGINNTGSTLAGLYGGTNNVWGAGSGNGAGLGTGGG